MPRSTPIRFTTTTSTSERRRSRANDPPVINITFQEDERRVFSVPEAAAVLGISRSKLYEFIAAGEIRTIHIGRLCKITAEGIDEFLASRPAGPAAARRD